MTETTGHAIERRADRQGGEQDEPRLERDGEALLGVDQQRRCGDHEAGQPPPGRQVARPAVERADQREQRRQQ
jgi:hypothetical protein